MQSLEQWLTDWFVIGDCCLERYFFSVLIDVLFGWRQDDAALDAARLAVDSIAQVHAGRGLDAAQVGRGRRDSDHLGPGVDDERRRSPARRGRHGRRLHRYAWSQFLRFRVWQSFT